MTTLRESWLNIAHTLGYRSEEEMLRDLYSIQKLSIGTISKTLGYSRNNVRNRLLELHIPLHSRGGPNRKGKGKAQQLRDEQLKSITAETAAALGLHPSAMWKEKRRRDELRTNSTEQLPEPDEGATGAYDPSTTRLGE